MCKYNCQFWPINFEVLDGISSVLGLRTSEEMGLIKRVGALSNNIVSQYADNFTGLGCIFDVTHHMPDARPVVHPPRRVPVTLRLKVKAKLQRMEKLRVFTSPQIGSTPLL